MTTLTGTPTVKFGCDWRIFQAAAGRPAPAARGPETGKIFAPRHITNLSLGGEILSGLRESAARHRHHRDNDTTVNGDKTVAKGLEKTFRLLTKTKNDAAVSVLLTSLDSARSEVRDGALCALLDRRGDAGGKELLERLPSMDEHWKEIIRARSGRMTGTLRNAVVGSDEAECETACQAIVEFCDYDLMPALINAAEDPSNPMADLMAQTVIELAEQLYDELARPRDKRGRRNPQAVRRSVTTALEGSTKRFGKHKRTEILEAFLVLASRDNFLLKKIIGDPYHEAYLPLVDLLTTSERRGVMRLVLSFLDDTQAPSSAMSILSHRKDRVFIGHLLKKIGFEPATVAKTNLRRIESIPWLTEVDELLGDLNDAEQHAAVQLAIACHIPQDDALAVIEYFLMNGQMSGRCAAAAALANFSGVEANELALAAMDDPEPRVQAAVIPHMRQRGIPGLMNRLLALVDSPAELVRAAIREQLVEFSFERFVGAFDHLSEEVRRTTGLLVKKVDPQAKALLAMEMEAKSRNRRIRAIAMIHAMNMESRMAEELVKLLKDEDHVLRSEAARALGECDGKSVIAALRECLGDRSVAVQEAAEESLQQIGQRAAAAASATDDEGHGTATEMKHKEEQAS